MATKLAVKKPDAQALSTWEARMAEDAKDAAAVEEVTSRSISCRGGQFTFGTTTLNNPLDVIVLASAHENAYYGEEEWDPDNPSSPVCFALSMDGRDMRPHDASTDKQHETCKGCPKNEFGSADKGKGKACKNIRRLQLMMPGMLGKPDEAEVATMKPSVTNVKAWSEYVQALKAKLNRPPYAVVTRITNAPDKKSQYKLGFTLASQIDMPQFGDGLVTKRAQSLQAVMAPYQPRAAREEESVTKTPARPKKYRA